MSSYLNFFLKEKRADNKDRYIHFMSISRSSDMYEVFNTSINLYSSEGNKTKIDLDLLHSIMEDIRGEINNNILILDTCKEYKSEEYSLQDLIDLRSRNKDLESLLSKIEMFCFIVEESTFDYSEIEGLYAYID